MNYPVDKTRINIDVMLQEALQYHRAGQLQEAKSIYEKILQSLPDHSDTVLLLSVLSLQEKKNRNVSRPINKTTYAYDHFYFNRLGVSLQEMGKIEEAISYYQKALRIKLDFPDAYNNMGVSYEALGKLNIALAYYKTALQIKPNHSTTLTNIASVYHNQGNLNGAILSCKKALEIEPNHRKALYNLGTILKVIVS